MQAACQHWHPGTPWWSISPLCTHTAVTPLVFTAQTGKCPPEEGNKDSPWNSLRCLFPFFHYMIFTLMPYNWASEKLFPSGKLVPALLIGQAWQWEHYKRPKQARELREQAKAGLHLGSPSQAAEAIYIRTKGKGQGLIYRDACCCQEGMPDYSHWLGFPSLMDLNSWREAEPDTEPKPSSSVCRLAHSHSLRVHSHAGDAEQRVSATCSSPANPRQLILWFNFVKVKEMKQCFQNLTWLRLPAGRKFCSS